MHKTSIGVETFFSLILSYFCFFVPAFRPCHGRLKTEYHQRNQIRRFRTSKCEDLKLKTKKRICVLNLPLRKYMST